MQMQRVASGGGHTISHRIDFEDDSHPPATGFVCITAQDIVSVMVGAGACKRNLCLHTLEIAKMAVVRSLILTAFLPLSLSHTRMHTYTHT